LPFDSPEARKVNAEMMETIYFAAVTASNEIAKVEGPYSSFKGSPASKGS
jgi:ribonucleotide reductase alpha subunit